MSKVQRYVLIGMGAFGQEIAYTLKEHHEDIIVMDKNLDVINQMKTDGFDFAVQIDSTESSTLSRFVTADDIVILSMGESFEDNIITVGILTRLKVKKIYTRATKTIHEEILSQMRNTEILFPEKEEGKRFALKLINRDFLFKDEYAPNVYITEIKVPKQFIDKSIIELQIRSNFKVNVIALKKVSEQETSNNKIQINYLGFENEKLTKDHILVVIGKEESIKEMID
jgi:trk system potassium uptake protein TrkA